jgi:hypothetical protein
VTTRQLALRAMPFLALPLVLAGCSQPLHIGTAATVGTVRISEQTLREVMQRDLADSATAKSQATPGALERQILGQLVADQLVADLARAYGVTATAQQVSAEIASIAAQEGGMAGLLSSAATAGIAPADLDRVIATIVLENAIAVKLAGPGSSTTSQQTALSEALLSEAAKEHVDINPRFGTFNEGEIVYAANPLSSPAPGTPSSDLPDSANPAGSQ